MQPKEKTFKDGNLSKGDKQTSPDGNRSHLSQVNPEVRSVKKKTSQQHQGEEQ